MKEIFGSTKFNYLVFIVVFNVIICKNFSFYLIIHINFKIALFLFICLLNFTISIIQIFYSSRQARFRPFLSTEPQVPVNQMTIFFINMPSQSSTDYYRLYPFSKKMFVTSAHDVTVVKTLIYTTVFTPQILTWHNIIAKNWITVLAIHETKVKCCFVLSVKPVFL